MSNWTISGPKAFRGTIEVPGDKSISHRACILGSLAEGQTRITNFLASDDCLRTLAAFEAMGTHVERISKTEVLIRGGRLNEPDNILDMGNSGTGVRLLAGTLAGQDFMSIISGDSSIRRRPMKRVCEPLRQMGATVLSRKGDLAPLVVRGGSLTGIEYISTVASAQVKSCLLLAGLFAKGTTSVTEPSRSRDHSERMLKAFGANLEVTGLTVSINSGNSLKAVDVQVPGDISSAAFFIVGGLICEGSDLVIRNVGVNPTRTGILDALTQMGADITLQNQKEASGEPVADLIVRHSELRGATFGGDLIPRMIDEIPILALAACFAQGKTIIQDAEELRVKESDRIATVAETLSAFGADIEPQDDGLIINGPKRLTPARVKSYGDHRIAMTSAIAAHSIAGEVLIEDTECVGTSFPGFTELLESATK